MWKTTSQMAWTSSNIIAMLELMHLLLLLLLHMPFPVMFDYWL